jgi:hypothetical protein
VHAVESGRLSRATLDLATRRFEALRSRYAKPVDARSGLAQLRSREHLAVVERILKDVEPSLSKVGVDPTEVMERIRVERAARG